MAFYQTERYRCLALLLSSYRARLLRYRSLLPIV